MPPIYTGGFAYVFLAQDLSSSRLVALKRLILADKQRLLLAKQEAMVMVRTPPCC